MTVSLLNYPTIQLEEYFTITIEPCIVNSLVADTPAWPHTGPNKLFDSTKQYLTMTNFEEDDIGYTDANGDPDPFLFAFRLYYPSTYDQNQLDIPSFTQTPLCNFDLEYTLKYADDDTYTTFSDIASNVDFMSLEVNDQPPETGGLYRSSGSATEIPVYTASHAWNQSTWKIYFATDDPTKDHCFYGEYPDGDTTLPLEK